MKLRVCTLDLDIEGLYYFNVLRLDSSCSGQHPVVGSRE
jgi:hypothetical protein